MPADSERVGDVAIDVDFGARFLLKLTLGLGTAFFGETFARSEHASRLRSAMWERDRRERARFDLKGASFINTLKSGRGDLLALEHCHVLALFPHAPALAISVLLYGMHRGVVEISDEPRVWQPCVPEDGLVWLVHPSAGRFVGPLPMPEYVAARYGGQPNDVREQLDALLVLGDELPPHHLDEATSA
jgi:hypothetical protein